MQVDLEYKLITFYGHLQHLFVVHLQQEPQVGLEHPIIMLLTGIMVCKVDTDHPMLDIHFYV